jgi:UMP-CMP kinase
MHIQPSLLIMAMLSRHVTGWTCNKFGQSSAALKRRFGLRSALSSVTTQDELAALTRSKVPMKQFGGLDYLDNRSFTDFRVIFVLGGPGAGKGSQSALMEENYPTVHFSVGELLREEQQRDDSPHRELLEQTLVAGKIVPVEISLNLLERAMQSKAESVKNGIFLVDGFPRNFDNLSGWSRYMSDVASIWSVLVYQCPLQVLEERILKRGLDSGRSDDNLASLKKRFRTFEVDTLPVIETMQRAALDANAHWSVVNIPGDQELDEVWEATRQVLDPLILNDVLTANALLLEAVESGNVNAYKDLCDPSWFDEKDASEVMSQQEGIHSGEPLNAQVEVVSGRKVAVSYDRIMQEGEHVRETRIWSHQGNMGWRNVQFGRVPV